MSIFSYQALAVRVSALMASTSPTFAGLTLTGTFNQSSYPLDITIQDNNTNAFTIKEGANSYLNISTLNGSEAFTFGKDVVMSGDLTVNGTTVTINSVNLNVADKNITVNVGGTTASTVGAGVNIEGDSAAVVGYSRVGSGDNTLWQIKAPVGNILTLDINADKTFTVGGALTINGDTTVDNWFDQSVKTTASPTFVGLNLSGLTASQAVVTDASKNLASLAYSTTATATNLAERDGNANLFANNMINNVTLVTSAAGTTNLTPSSSRSQILTGTTTQTFKLPNCNSSGMAVGATFIFNNNSTGLLTITDFGGTTIGTVPSDGRCTVVCRDVATTSGIWDIHSDLGHTWTCGSTSLDVPNGSAIAAGKTASDTALFTAYDTDNTTYRTFVTLTSGATPSIGISAPSGASGTIDNIAIGGTTPSTIKYNAVVIAKTNGSGSPYSVLTTDSGAVFTNTGASAEVYLSLPAATSGLVYEGVCTDTDLMRFTANGTDTIRHGGSVSTAGGYLQLGVLGTTVCLKCVESGKWTVMFANGTINLQTS